MTSKGALAAVLLAAMAGTWWWVLSGPTFQAVPAVASPRPPQPLPDRPPHVALERLRTDVPALDAPARDPFGGAAGPPVPSPGTRTADPTRPGAEADARVAPTAARWPALALIGLGTTRTPEGTEHVAVFAGERGVLHGKVGDVVADVYRVERIGDDAVEVTLVPEQRRLTWRLP